MIENLVNGLSADRISECKKIITEGTDDEEVYRCFMGCQMRLRW